jgi:hypothetical protein
MSAELVVGVTEAIIEFLKFLEFILIALIIQSQVKFHHINLKQYINDCMHLFVI